MMLATAFNIFHVTLTNALAFVDFHENNFPMLDFNLMHFQRIQRIMGLSVRGLKLKILLVYSSPI